MSAVHTDADFEHLSWHDCRLWGLDMRAGSPDEDDWTSDLVLDIDFIVEWLSAADRTRFRVAPATLAFHGVTDLTMILDSGDSGFRVALQEVTIDRIERRRVEHQQVYLDRPYYRWRVAFASRPAGEIVFGAVGFTQTLRAAPVISERQHLSLRQRA